MLRIDGSKGEGGGQILRTALALSAVTGTPFQIDKIRAGRARPGLMRQHATAVRAAAEICGARAEGAEPGSTALRFEPGSARGGEYRFAVGTAGSATLVLQTILPALLLASNGSSLLLEGGTHNPSAPPFDFLVRSFLPQLARMGARVTATLERPGFYPAGGGRFRVAVEPWTQRVPFTLLERGVARMQTAEAIVAGLPSRIAERELAVVGQVLGWARRTMRATTLEDAYGPGNVVIVTLESAEVTEVVTGFGERAVPAEQVGENAAKEAARYLAVDVPVGEHLADQLLLPMALAGGGAFRTLEPSSHTRTQAEILPLFLPVEVRMEAEGGDRWRVEVVRKAS
ncbi:MAG TPA: RNA 3'-terminal phosphate cyclase [Polyangiaceae bacterium]|jgi:RNA 3'-terminal phosphate cyclase (ATP)